VPGGDEEVGHTYYSNGIWTVGQMTIFRKKIFSVKRPFGQMTIFSKKTFGQMNFRSNVISVIWLVFQIWFSVKLTFSKYFRSNDLLINFVFGQMIYFGKINFRSNGVRSNGVSVKWPFGQMAFQSNGLSVKWCSVEWCSVKRCSVKWCFGQLAFGQKIR
jgi:hypothetical protein